MTLNEIYKLAISHYISQIILFNPKNQMKAGFIYDAN